ncbi:unnamed protein product [Prunus armeniaca]
MVPGLVWSEDADQVDQGPLNPARLQLGLTLCHRDLRGRVTNGDARGIDGNKGVHLSGCRRASESHHRAFPPPALPRFDVGFLASQVLVFIFKCLFDSELPKGIVLDEGGHVNIRHITPSPLVDVGCYNTPPLEARRPRWHTRTTLQNGSDTKLSHPGIDFAVARYCLLWALLSALTVLFLGTHEQLPSGSPILGLL